MNNQHIVSNWTYQHSLHIVVVPASWVHLCSGPDQWIEEDFIIICLDMKTQKHLQIRVIANQGSFAKQCRLFRCRYDQDICNTISMTCDFASDMFQAFTSYPHESLRVVLVGSNNFFFRLHYHIPCEIHCWACSSTCAAFMSTIFRG